MNGPNPKSLGAMIAGFKSVVTKRINEMRHTPGSKLRQRNYYEHIIRNDESLNRIREYIVNNPTQWEHDRENPKIEADPCFRAEDESVGADLRVLPQHEPWRV